MSDIPKELVVSAEELLGVTTRELTTVVEGDIELVDDDSTVVDVAITNELTDIFLQVKF